MKEILDQWNEQLIVGDFSPHTIRNYLSSVKQFLQCADEAGFDPLKLDRATVFVYFSFLTKKYTNRATIMRKRDGVKQFYSFLREERLVRVKASAIARCLSLKRQ